MTYGEALRSLISDATDAPVPAIAQFVAFLMARPRQYPTNILPDMSMLFTHGCVREATRSDYPWPFPF